MEVRRPAELDLEVPEFGEEGVLAVDVLVELLGPLGGGAEGGLLGPQLVEAGLLLADLRLDVVEQGLEEDVLVEPVVVDPEGVVLLRRLEQPVDRGLAAALGVALQVEGEEETTAAALIERKQLAPARFE